jgi:hypothetical protein
MLPFHSVIVRFSQTSMLEYKSVWSEKYGLKKYKVKFGGEPERREREE